MNIKYNAGQSLFSSGSYNICNKKAFSILEMVIVIAIIGTLTIFAAQYLIQTIDDAKVAKTKALLEKIKEACLRYYSENGFYPSNVNQLYPKYLVKHGNLILNSWGKPFRIDYYEGRANVWCEVPEKINYKKRLSLTLDTIGFERDNRFTITKPAFSFTKVAVAPSGAGNTQKFDIEFEIAYELSDGADFKFQITGATMESALSSQAVPIEITSSDGSETSSFEYSCTQKDKDTILIKLKDCRRTAGFTFQLYRPVQKGISMYYGQRLVLLSIEGSAPPITLMRALGESTKRK